MRALVLNATYEPLSVVSSRRAVVLLLGDKVEMVEPAPVAFRTPTMEVVVPSVVRLRRFVRAPRFRTAPLTRQAVFARDGGRCQYCGRPAECIDHVVPRSRGGSHTWDNVVASCRSCNTRKADRLLDDTPFRLLSPPQVPSIDHWVFTANGGAADPRWVPYLVSA